MALTAALLRQRFGDDRPLELPDLAAYLAKGCKPVARHRVGAEHEKLIRSIAEQLGFDLISMRLELFGKRRKP